MISFNQLTEVIKGYCDLGNDVRLRGCEHTELQFLLHGEVVAHLFAAGDDLYAFREQGGEVRKSWLTDIISHISEVLNRNRVRALDI
ncbi:hypothetical protein [Vannielia litorea]|uniref:hypothetical protein n=1 Tax=Vannielia litorea TaxID=1217970 RepID=UPI001BCD4F28|nr:hypothetical protein [Vannielia litorea]MBS8226669.1 hypothetical protein [Vannielia litorea]